MIRIQRASEIKNFYVEARQGLWLAGNVLPFGASVNVENLSNTAKQTFYARGLIGSADQVARIAQKFGLVFKPVEACDSGREHSCLVDVLATRKSPQNVLGKK